MAPRRVLELAQQCARFVELRVVVHPHFRQRLLAK
jgi:hypothetical protein